MRMASAQFPVQCFQDILHREEAFPFAKGGVIENLEQNIAQLFDQVIDIIVLDRFGHFFAFFLQIRQQAFVRLRLHPNIFFYDGIHVSLGQLKAFRSLIFLKRWNIQGEQVVHAL